MFDNLGDKLKICRIQCGMSRKQVAELIGVSVGIIGLYETGDRLPSLTVIVKLAAHYKVSVDYLLDCEIKDKNALSLEGLSVEQIRALKMTADCFRNSKR